MKRSQPEQALQRQVVQFLALALDGNSTFLHVPNGGLRSLSEARRFKEMGVRAGAPDLLVICDGRAIWLEMKSGTGRVSDVQAAFHEELRRARSPVAVCRSLDDVIAALVAAGVPLRAKLEAA